MLTDRIAQILPDRVRARLVIGFAGQPGSGTTTLQSGATANSTRRCGVVIEDVFEAGTPIPNVTQIQIRAPQVDRPAVYPRRLVDGFLRTSPDVAIVDEARERERPPNFAPTMTEW